MARINVLSAPRYDDPYSTEEPRLLGWFDDARAESFAEATRWDGSNHISVNTGSQWEHQRLYRTAGGRWVMHEWSQWQGTLPSYRFVGDEQAREWLLLNGHDEDAARFFGPLEDEHGPIGRPEVGPALNVRLTPELLAAVDAAASKAGETRAATIRRLLASALAT